MTSNRLSFECKRIKSRKFVLNILLTGLACGISANQVLAEDSGKEWPSFLGTGHKLETDKNLPVEWSPHKNVEWKTTVVGHGQSSPVIWGKNVYVTTVDGQNKERQILHCLDLYTGKPNWTQETANLYPVKNTFYVSRAAPTPVVDDEGVYAFFEGGQCVAFSHAGEQLWERDLAKEFGPFEAEFGLGASPCQTDRSIFILLEHAKPGHLVALNKNDGSTKWVKSRPAGNSWSSPATFQVENVVQIVVSSNGSVVAYDPENGSELWTLDGLQGNTSVTPIDFGNGTLLTGASPARQAQGEDLSKRSNGLIQILKFRGESSSDWTAEFLWRNEKLSPSWGSPVVSEGLGYWVNRVGVVTCVDLNSGETIYSERLKQTCWATPYVSNSHIYFFGKEGLCTVIEKGRTFKVVSENQLFNMEELPAETTVPEPESSPERRQASSNFSGPTVYGIAVKENRIIARIGHQVYSLAIPDAK